MTDVSQHTRNMGARPKRKRDQTMQQPADEQQDSVQAPQLTPYQEAVLETAAYGLHAVLHDHDESTAYEFALELNMIDQNPPRSEVAAAMYRWVHTHAVRKD